MTDRFKEALNFINFKMAQDCIETEEYYHIFKYHKQDIIEALNLATESEELKAKLDKAKWQPIESAPTSKGCIFIVTGKTETPCVVTRTGKDWTESGYPFCAYHTQTPFHKHKFTHWMPLPDAPEQR